jgi:hypothetical protein
MKEDKMNLNNRIFLIFGIAVCLSALVFASPADAQRGYGMHHGMWSGGQGGGWSYCPYCGGRLDDRDQYPEGRGYDQRDGNYGRGGYHRGPGMMGPGYGRYGMMAPDYRRDNRRYEEPMKMEEAKEQVEEMLDQSRNPNLKTGEIQDKEQFFVVDIVTQDGSLVDKMEVDKKTGMMRSVY